MNDNIEIRSSLNYKIAIDIPLISSSYTYSSENELFPGNIVEVPFGIKSKPILGVVESSIPPTSEISPFKIKSIKEVLPLQLSEKEWALYQWMSRYYHYSLGKIVIDSLPPLKSKIVECKTLIGENKKFEIPLNDELQQVIAELKKNVRDILGFSSHLIHGVTGSGKGLALLALIKQLIEENQSALFLLPEINLTPQFKKFFSTYLNCPIVVYNSSVSNNQKLAIYNLLKNTSSPVLVLAARSGIFLEIANLGAIIIDEEHDQSYKQEDRCSFHVRTVAYKKAKLYGVPLVFASATPSLEIYQEFYQNNASASGKFLYQLPHRLNETTLPVVEVTAPVKESESSWPISEDLLKSMEHIINNSDDQILVLVNKLGFAKYLTCPNCKLQFDCPKCSTHLTYFKKRQTLECKFCEYNIYAPKSCPKCGCLDIMPRGFGTEKVMEVLKNRFDEKILSRFDRDEIRTPKQVEKALGDFERGITRILIGTQMLSKGHNFLKVKMVLVLGIDAYLHYPDFRAQEKIFQLLNQVIGRAGRFGGSSNAYVQTALTPEQLEIYTAQNLTSFYERELMLRKMTEFPPYSQLVTLTFKSTNKDKMEKYVQLIYKKFIKTIDDNKFQIRLMAPRNTFTEKINNEFGMLLVFFTSQASQLQQLLYSYSRFEKPVSGVTATLDVDAQHLA